jgi:hypothetical protein
MSPVGQSTRSKVAQDEGEVDQISSTETVQKEKKKKRQPARSRLTVEIHSLPKWIVTRIKRPPVRVKLVTEDQLIILPIKPGPGHDVLRRILIYQTGEIRHLRDLPRRVDPTEVEPGRVGSIGSKVIFVKHDDGPTGEQGNQGAEEDKDGQDVDPTTERPRVPVVSVGNTLWVRSMKSVVQVVLPVVPQHVGGRGAILTRRSRRFPLVVTEVMTMPRHSRCRTRPGTKGGSGLAHAHAVERGGRFLAGEPGRTGPGRGVLRLIRCAWRERVLRGPSRIMLIISSLFCSVPL